MGAVDQLDMLRCGWYSIAMRGRRNRWPVRYFEGLIDMTIATVLRIAMELFVQGRDRERELSHFELMLAIQDYLLDPNKNPYIRNKRKAEGNHSSSSSS